MMKILIICILSIVSSLFLIACSNVTTRTIHTTNIFDLNEFQSKISPKGKNTIAGFAYSTGIHIPFAGSIGIVEHAVCEEVGLIPATPYSTERIEKIYGNTTEAFQPLSNTILNFIPENSSYLKNIRYSKCAIDGSFVFNNVSDGEYYLTTIIAKKIRDNMWRGGMALKKVILSNAQVAEVFLISPFTQKLKTLHYGDPPANYENIFKKTITYSLKDPSSGLFRNIQQPKKMWIIKQVNSQNINTSFSERVTPYWIICGEVNAKNSFGGFTGYKLNAILYSQDASTQIAPLVDDRLSIYPNLPSEDNPCGTNQVSK